MAIIHVTDGCILNLQVKHDNVNVHSCIKIKNGKNLPMHAIKYLQGLEV